MTLYFLRYIVGDAGNIERMYWAIKIALKHPDESLWQRQFLRDMVTEKGEKMTGMLTLKSQRSFEPHQAFAREIGFLEKGDRWRVTPDAGQAFLRLWDEDKLRPPTYLVLKQFLLYDRTISVPFIRGILKFGIREGPEIIARIWDWLWKKHPNEMESREPPLPKSLRKSKTELKRTCSHHSQCRTRLLMKSEGLSLNKKQLERIQEHFENFQFTKFPSDHYLRIGYAESGIKPQEIGSKNMNKKIFECFALFKTSFGYASATAVFDYINSKILPAEYLDWNSFLKHIHSNNNFSAQSGFDSKDVLFTVRRKNEKKN